jgi:beta-glucuronidase
MMMIVACAAFADVLAAELTPSQITKLDGDHWLIAADPGNIGQKEEWQKAPLPKAKPATVPKIAQFALPSYHGVMWYWRDVSLPALPEQHSRYLLRFLAVFYKADVYLNGQSVGSHEGGETPFTLDITEFARPGQKNLLAVRVLDPLPDRVIDGMKLDQVPHRTYGGNYIPTPGGIIDSVELLVRPAVYVSDLCVRPDWKTGRVEIDAEVVNTLDRSVP